tara:strand:- start:1055 stop:1525 length:471 start_codon:yes stop_codon:yes gene_type:complete
MKAIKLDSGEIKVFASTPKNWGAVICGFDTFSDEKLATYGFYNVVTPSIKSSQEYGDIEWDEDNKVFTYPVKNRTYSKTVAQLKTGKIQNLKSIYGVELSKTDWYVVRAAEGGKAIPESIKTERSNLRTECATKEAEINALSTKSSIADYELPNYR